MDFTESKYKALLISLKNRYTQFLPLGDYKLSHTNHSSIVLLRHDVDRIPRNALSIAKLEHSLGIYGSYYFRIVEESFDYDIIKEIESLGHEIGYHYEDVDLVIQRQKLKVKNENEREKLLDLAYESFCKNLDKFRKITDIRTICMHGSPLSKFDNKIIWEKYNYKDLNIIAEPYFDIDFNEFAYFTDTGRKWNGSSVSVRDKVNSNFNYNFRSTQNIIKNINTLPDQIMFTLHPERWHNNIFLWSKEIINQNIKNIIKRIFYVVD